VQDVKTRWNSTFLMLQSIKFAHGDVKLVIKNNTNPDVVKKHEDGLLTDDELKIVNDLVVLGLPINHIFFSYYHI
jgi:hypothetical protein